MRRPSITRTAAETARHPGRRGAGSLDYVLTLGVILPIVAIVMPLGQRIIARVYEMMLVLIAWPFL